MEDQQKRWDNTPRPTDPPTAGPVPELSGRPQAPLPSVGRIVRYVPHNSTDPAASNMAKVVPAIIVSTWEPFVCNLQVFVDGDKGTIWKTSVKYDGNQTPGTWHWPAIN